MRLVGRSVNFSDPPKVGYCIAYDSAVLLSHGTHKYDTRKTPRRTSGDAKDSIRESAFV